MTREFKEYPKGTILSSGGSSRIEIIGHADYYGQGDALELVYPAKITGAEDGYETFTVYSERELDRYRYKPVEPRSAGHYRWRDHPNGAEAPAYYYAEDPGDEYEKVTVTAA